MAEPILIENMEKAQFESNLSITSNDIKIDLSKEFLVELQKNMYHETHYEDVVDHIAKESKYENPSNTATDSFFKAYELPNKRRCKAEKYGAIQYSLRPNEEYIAIRSYEYDIEERNEDNMSKIYQDIFQKKDEGWKTSIRRPRERKIDECWCKIYKSGDTEVLES
ncbi:hypothetical protein Tco_0808386 [Tanacetum coccineum]